ncbi:gamma-type small acid-soluble spore protein [Sutcliffiella horikoshii]|uniref:gamma-type small acid-soluble spore protein n=1 Tax=Sutcliffiella horikoshii TaxID=79883 RepID=UPI001EEE2D11|nr:gamma-type small acid-soluble spore protein [Sutcliffiella horikoshii]MCG1023163.1 gamma-type small acid-soluble spore protein [Sutcliffiella horikoshii]
MANNNQQNQAKTASGTSIQHVKQQNAQQNQQQYGAEFASETNAQEVRQQNAQSAAQKNQQNR